MHDLWGTSASNLYESLDLTFEYRTTGYTDPHIIHGQLWEPVTGQKAAAVMLILWPHMYRI
jgi:hypothetical protein